MKHDPSTEGIVRRLGERRHKNIPGHGFARKGAVVVAHGHVQSVNTDSGMKPHAHGREGDCNVASNKTANDAMRSSGNPRLTTDPAQLAGAGVFKSN